MQPDPGRPLWQHPRGPAGPAAHLQLAVGGDRAEHFHPYGDLHWARSCSDQLHGRWPRPAGRPTSGRGSGPLRDDLHPAEPSAPRHRHRLRALARGPHPDSVSREHRHGVRPQPGLRGGPPHLHPGHEGPVRQRQLQRKRGPVLCPGGEHMGRPGPGDLPDPGHLWDCAPGQLHGDLPRRPATPANGVPHGDVFVPLVDPCGAARPGPHRADLAPDAAQPHHPGLHAEVRPRPDPHPVHGCDPRCQGQPRAGRQRHHGPAVGQHHWQRHLGRVLGDSALPHHAPEGPPGESGGPWAASEHHDHLLGSLPRRPGVERDGLQHSCVLHWGHRRGHRAVRRRGGG
eukprot:RCo033502